MKAISRLGSGGIARWFNGWWVMALAVLMGVCAPMLLALRSRGEGVDKTAPPLGFFGNDNTQGAAPRTAVRRRTASSATATTATR